MAKRPETPNRWHGDSILLFDAECAPCTEVGKQLKALNVPRLEVKALNDPEVVEMLENAGHQAPDEPTLVDIDGGAITLHQGLAMRLRIARRIGFRRAGTLLGLLAAETRARRERTNNEGRAVSRRRFMGGAAAAGVGAVVFGSANPANAQPASAAPQTLTPEAAQQLRSVDTVADAMRVWGDPAEEAIRTIPGRDGETIATFSHSDREVMTFIDLESPQFAITLRVDAERGALQYFTTAGAPLAEAQLENGEVQVSVLDASAAPGGADIGPQGPVEVAACMAVCLGATVGPGCAESCISCLTGSILGCANCALCAGPDGVRCARLCREFW